MIRSTAVVGTIHSKVKGAAMFCSGAAATIVLSVETGLISSVLIVASIAWVSTLSLTFLMMIFSS